MAKPDETYSVHGEAALGHRIGLTSHVGVDEQKDGVQIDAHQVFGGGML
jgi:hypothetical protein